MIHIIKHPERLQKALEGKKILGITLPWTRFDPNSKLNGKYAIEYAAYYGNYLSLYILLAYGAKITPKAITIAIKTLPLFAEQHLHLLEGKDLFMGTYNAIVYDKKTIFKELLSRLTEKEYSLKTENTEKTLFHAASKYKLYYLKKLLERFPPIISQDIYKKTPFHYAAPSHEKIKLLLQHTKCLVDAQDIAGNTALHYAVSNHISVRLLLNYIDPYIQNEEGNTFFHLFVQEYVPPKEIIDILSKHPDLIFIKNNLKQTPFDLAHIRLKKYLT